MLVQHRLLPPYSKYFADSVTLMFVMLVDADVQITACSPCGIIFA